MARSNNEDRAHWRTQCRNRLSEHIRTKLGIVVSPTDVRLITGPDDPYKWSRLPGYENLFQKHLSKHSTGAYIKIYYGVGKFFEAVPADLEVELSYSSMGCQEVYPLPISGSDGGELQQTGYELDHAISGLSGSPSFSETISRLEDKNIQLKSELNNCRRLMEAETQLKESTEAELERTKMALKNLQERFRKLVVTHSFYRTKAHKLQKGFSEIHKLSQQFQETTNVRPLTHV